MAAAGRLGVAVAAGRDKPGSVCLAVDLARSRIGPRVRRLWRGIYLRGHPLAVGCRWSPSFQLGHGRSRRGAGRHGHHRLPAPMTIWPSAGAGLVRLRPGCLDLPPSDSSIGSAAWRCRSPMPWRGCRGAASAQQPPSTRGEPARWPCLAGQSPATVTKLVDKPGDRQASPCCH